MKLIDDIYQNFRSFLLRSSYLYLINFEILKRKHLSCKKNDHLSFWKLTVICTYCQMRTSTTWYVPFLSIFVILASSCAYRLSVVRTHLLRSFTVAYPILSFGAAPSLHSFLICYSSISFVSWSISVASANKQCSQRRIGCYNGI